MGVGGGDDISAYDDLVETVQSAPGFEKDVFGGERPGAVFVPEEKVDAMLTGPSGKAVAHYLQEVDEAGEVVNSEDHLAA